MHGCFAAHLISPCLACLTEEEADDNLCSIAMEASAAFSECGELVVPERCSGAHAVVSLLLLAACLLLALTSF